jgi:hypothetical protein
VPLKFPVNIYAQIQKLKANEGILEPQTDKLNLILKRVFVVIFSLNLIRPLPWMEEISNFGAEPTYCMWLPSTSAVRSTHCLLVEMDVQCFLTSGQVHLYKNER